jgi:hypothetical protein
LNEPSAEGRADSALCAEPAIEEPTEVSTIACGVSSGDWNRMSGVGQKIGLHTAEPAVAPGDSMLDLFLSMLDVRTVAIEQNVGQDAAAQEVLQSAKSKLSELRGSSRPPDGAMAWNEAYRIERMLCLVEPAEVMLLDLDRRVDEAAAQKLSSLDRLKADVDRAKNIAYDNTKTPPVLNVNGLKVLRNAMNNILEELHWEDQKRFFATPLLKQAVRRTVGLATIVFALVLLPYLYLYGSYLFGYSGKIEYPDKIPSVATWVWLPLFTVLTVGAFGAYFSRLYDISTNSSRFSTIELESAGTWRNLFLRGAVGILGAFILFLFLKSGLVRGSMFPDFTKMGLDFLTYGGPGDGGADAIAQAGSSQEIIHLIMPSSALALLAMWSFLAGFSERLVPSILANTESSLAKSANIAGN